MAANQNMSHQIAIVGGGAGGMSVAAALKRARPGLDIALIEPSQEQYYQAGWTLVGGGSMTQAQTVRPRRQFVPAGVEWLQHRVAEFSPDQNQLVLDSGDSVQYEYLVVAMGIQLDWSKVDGLVDTLGKNGVTSNYQFDLAPYTWECIQTFKGGKALFTQPPMPIKCAGAPQKILYLAADHWRKNGVNSDVHFFNQGGAMFGVPFFAKALDGIMKGYNATPHFGHHLVAVDGPGKTATFELADGETVTEAFDMLHVTPPQSAPDVIKQSPLADSGGWLEVDRNTLQHTRYANVFGLGDCTNTPNAKTAAAARAQFPVVSANLLSTMDSRDQSGSYDGYGGCPLTVESGKVMLVEFRYDGEIVPSFNADPRIPRRRYWVLKERIFPFVYWYGMLRGRDWKYPVPKLRPAVTTDLE